MRRSTSQQVALPKLALLAAAAAIAFLLLSSACGGSTGGRGFPLSGGQGSEGSEVSAAGVTLTLPAGWAFLDNDERGLVLASQNDDLRADVPQGPRLTVERGSTAPPDPEALVSAMPGAGAEAATSRLEVVEEPETVQVGIEEGVSIGLLEDDGGGAVIKRYVIVNADGIHVYQFVLEAPEDQWNGNVGALEAILASTTFEPPVVAQAPTTSVPLAGGGGPADPAPQPTSTPVPPGPAGFATPEEAVYAAFGFETSPIADCNSGRPGAGNPCHDLHHEINSGETGYQIVYIFNRRSGFADYYWVLVAQLPDGTFEVADTVPMGGEFGAPNPPF